MNLPTKIVIACLFAALVVYALSNSGLLQRVSYDIYKCTHRTEGTAKLWFNKMSKGQPFELTLNEKISKPVIDDIEEGRIIFSVGNVAFSLDTTTKRLIKEETGAVVFFMCDLNEFRM